MKRNRTINRNKNNNKLEEHQGSAKKRTKTRLRTKINTWWHDPMAIDKNRKKTVKDRDKVKEQD